jgi:hypothetical protein
MARLAMWATAFTVADWLPERASIAHGALDGGIALAAGLIAAGLVLATRRGVRAVLR